MIENYSQNLKNLRAHLNLSAAKLADLIDISANTISAYERGLRCPSMDFGVRLYEKLNVNLNWFSTGIGEMFVNICENTHNLAPNNKTASSFKNWGKRLNKILIENEVTPYAFSKLTGIKESRIEKFIIDSIEPTITEINAIKSNVDVAVDWLLYGESVAADNGRWIATASPRNDERGAACNDSKGQVYNNEGGLSFTNDEILKLKQMLRDKE